MSDTSKPGPVNESRIRRSRLFLLLSVAAVLLAVFIGFQVIGTLYYIVFPVMPPLPEGVREMRHETSEYGVDTWVYTTDQDTCSVLAFYREQADGCLLTPYTCESDSTLEITAYNQNVGRCQGNESFSIFTMTWKVNIATGDGVNGATSFRLEREVFWTGAEDRPTPEFPDS